MRSCKSIPQLSASDLRRFWKYVEISDTDSCWPWVGYHLEHGYGLFGMGSVRKMFLTHRISYSLIHGDPGDFMVCHACDNPPCVNPGHLFRGTQVDNMRDAWDRGRYSRKPIKITRDQAETIRRISGTQEQIGKQFGISQSMVSMIRNHRVW